MAFVPAFSTVVTRARTTRLRLSRLISMARWDLTINLGKKLMRVRAAGGEL